MRGDVDAFLPTLEKARAAKADVRARVWWRKDGVDLLAEEPSATKKLAAILTIARDASGEVVLRYPYVPSMPFALEEGTAQLFERHAGDPPECLRVDLERRGSGDPYRGAPVAVAEFHGFEYEDALPQARARLGALRSAHPPGALEVHTFAWPILRLSYQQVRLRRELALLVRPDRVMHAMLCRARWR